MNKNKIINILIKNLPPNAIKSLRKTRLFKESIYRLLYLVGYKKEKYLPFFLKYDAKKDMLDKHDHTSDINRWGKAFLYYRSIESDYRIDIIWADGPAPGNLGDWLSPYIISKLTKVSIRHLNEAGSHKNKHVVGLGSIIPLVNKHSIVLGAGIASKNEDINLAAHFTSVRGPYSAKRIRDLGGDDIKSYGDIGFLMSKLYTPKNIEKKSKYLVVRHINQANFKLQLQDDFRENYISHSHPSDIEQFVDELHSADIVATSAMHCFILCISYGIPAILFSIGGEKEKVAGDGVKYLDALAGVKLKEVSPILVSTGDNFCEKIREQDVYREIVSEEVLTNIECSINEAVSLARYKNQP